MDRDEIVARVVIEERFVAVARARGLTFREIAALAATPPHNGGIGFYMRPLTARERLAAYRRRIEDLCRQRVAEEDMRRLWEVEGEMRAALDDLDAAKFGSRAYRAADRRYEITAREERRLYQLGEFEGVPVAPPKLTKRLRESAELSAALDVAEAVALRPVEEHDALFTTLDLAAPGADVRGYLRRLVEGRLRI